jgi:hypothetical protein
VSEWDSPDPATRARFDEAIQEVAEVYVDACRERDQLAMTDGTLAVARQARFPGHCLGSIKAIQARYDSLQAEARLRQNQDHGSEAG